MPPRGAGSPKTGPPFSPRLALRDLRPSQFAQQFSEAFGWPIQNIGLMFGLVRPHGVETVVGP